MDKRPNPSPAGQKRQRSLSPCIDEKLLTTARSQSSTTQLTPSIDFACFDLVACAKLTKEFSSLSAVKRRISKKMKSTYPYSEYQDAVRLLTNFYITHFQSFSSFTVIYVAVGHFWVRCISYFNCSSRNIHIDSGWLLYYNPIQENERQTP